MRWAVSSAASIVARVEPSAAESTISPPIISRPRARFDGVTVTHLMPSSPRSGQAAGIALAKPPSSWTTWVFGVTEAEPSARASSVSRMSAT